MQTFLVVCLVLNAFEFTFAHSPTICGPYSEFSDCACCHQRYCGSLFYNGGVDLNQCPDGCDKGCICSDGYYYNEITQRCCLAEHCNKPCCPANRVYKECGTACPASCDNPHPKYCPLKCVEGCFCKEGLVEDGNGNCIPLQNCTQHCPPNEIFDPCVNPCQPNCLEPFKQPCQSLLCQKGCVCRPPFVRDEASGKCVDKHMCEKQCPNPNEGYYTCKPCLLKCGRCPRSPCHSPDVCVPGCQCKPGFVWHPIRKMCVPQEFCNC